MHCQLELKMICKCIYCLGWHRPRDDVCGVGTRSCVRVLSDSTIQHRGCWTDCIEGTWCAICSGGSRRWVRTIMVVHNSMFPLATSSHCLCHSCSTLVILYLGTRGFKMRIGPPYPHARRKRQLKWGRFLE